MKLPRDLSGADLAKALKKLGYVITRQKSSHIRMTTKQNGEHHVTIPDHDVIKIGTLADILGKWVTGGQAIRNSLPVKPLRRGPSYLRLVG